jgi:SAM-dependent methyltransferase
VIHEAEPWQFPDEGFRLLDRVEAAIRPDDPALEDWFRRYCREHQQRLAADLHLIGRHVAPEARVLEYGAIPLVLTAALASLDYAVSALDIGPERFARSISNLGLEVIACDVETEAVPFEDATFDVVLFNELFEHLRINPIFTFREVHRVLRPGGLLLLSTPNLRSLRGLRNLVFRNEGHAASSGVYQQYEKLETLGHMGHVREYTTREVVDFLRRSGFNVEKVVFRGGHGRGPVGILEKLVPSLRPFFALVARKGESEKNESDRGGPADLEGETQ